MTEQEKQLLLQDLCARLLYGVRVKLNGRREKSNRLTIDWLYTYSRHIEDIKPYLRPIWSMTNEEQEEFVGFHCVNLCPIIMDEMLTLENETKMFDWLNTHHFDYRDLIQMGLALEAPEGMYKGKDETR